MAVAEDVFLGNWKVEAVPKERNYMYMVDLREESYLRIGGLFDGEKVFNDKRYIGRQELY